MTNKKRAVVTINIGEFYREVSKMTIPTMRAYAERIGAEFIEINEAKLSNKVDNYSAYWAKFQLYNHLENYDRLIYLDLDTVVRPQCPDLFDVVSEDEFGALFETDYIKSKHVIDELVGPDGSEDWEGNYFNVGVMVISKCHRPAFKLESFVYCGKKYPEQTLLNANIRKLDCPVKHLDYRYNHMYFIGQDNRKRGDSFIIHYAGIPQPLRAIVIPDDLRRFEENIPALTIEEIQPLFREKLQIADSSELEYKLKRDEEIGLF